MTGISFRSVAAIAVPAFFLGLAVGVFGHSAMQGESSGIEASAPGIGTVKVNTKGRTDYATALRQLFADPKQRSEVVAWLESNAKMYSPTSDALPDAVASTACEPFSNEVTPEVIAAKRACAEKLNVRRFRQLASDHKPPFHYVGLLGAMGVPGGGNRLSHGSANACRPGDLFGKRLQVANPESGVQLEVVANGSYICTGALPAPDIQLGIEDAKKLFPDRALAKTEQVLIVPLE